MRLDDFDEYMKAKREELGATPQQFWSEYLWTLANVVTWAAACGGLYVYGNRIADLFASLLAQ